MKLNSMCNRADSAFMVTNFKGVNLSMGTTEAATLKMISSSAKPLCAYRIAKHLRVAPMAMGRTLLSLQQKGKIRAIGVAGDNPLAEEFLLSAR